MKLKDRVAIVTGGGRGIGRAIALALAEDGADVAVVSRTSAEIDRVAVEIKALGRHALALRADVSDREAVDTMVGSVIGKWGKVDILVNNAGIQGPIGSVIETGIDEWIKTVHVNLIGTFLCTRAVLPGMIKQQRGKIINLSGGGATSPRPNFTAYGVSKTGVVRFTETVAEEVSKFNIQVNAIAPGSVNTRMTEELLSAGKAAGDKAISEARNQLETGGTPPEKAAALAVFLASEKSDGLTGRLISAVWDDWQQFPGQIEKIMASDLYTLRRIVE